MLTKGVKGSGSLAILTEERGEKSEGNEISFDIQLNLPGLLVIVDLTAIAKLS